MSKEPLLYLYIKTLEPDLGGTMTQMFTVCPHGFVFNVKIVYG